MADRLGRHPEWVTELDQLRGLEPHADDAAFRSEWRYIKRAIKEEFSGYLRRRTGIAVDPQSLFDVQVKRIHEYKRQHLNVLHIVALYHRLKNDPDLDLVPRTFIFGSKAAPGYHMAKLMIRLITAVGDVVNSDPAVADRLKVVFVPNFNVGNGQQIYPAAELSEQISTAGKEIVESGGIGGDEPIAGEVGGAVVGRLPGQLGSDVRAQLGYGIRAIREEVKTRGEAVHPVHE